MQNTRVEIVTPELAKTYLELSKGNRTISQGRVTMFARLMSDGKWKQTHQGIAFDEFGNFADGHHRMLSVIKAGIPVAMNVSRNVPHDALPAIDGGQPRNVRQALEMAGLGRYGTDQIAVARSYLSAPSMDTTKFRLISPEEILDIIREYNDGIEFACSRTGHITGLTRGVKTCIARAYYHVDADRLSKFCSVLRSLIPVSANPEEDSAAQTLFRFLSGTKGGRSQSCVETEKYQKTQAAIRSFVNRQPMNRACGVTEDLFPVSKNV